MRITRTPIAAIETIYESTKTWTDETIECSCHGVNILADVSSKKFDLIAEFDLNGATAREIEFKVANKSINYDIEEQHLMGKSLKPDANNHLKIRIFLSLSMSHESYILVYKIP